MVLIYRIFIALTKEEKYKAIQDIKVLIHEKNITEYIDLLDILEMHDDFNLFKVACDNTILFNALLRSKRHRMN